MASIRRRVLGILNALCTQVGIDPAAFVARMNERMDHYGPDNHLKADFPLEREWDAELLDIIGFPVLAVSIGRVPADSKVLGVYLKAAKTMIAAQKAMLSQGERDAAPDCYGDCLTCDSPPCPRQYEEGVENGC